MISSITVRRFLPRPLCVISRILSFARFTEEGATVVVNDLQAADAETMAAELGGDSMGVGFDVSD